MSKNSLIYADNAATTAVLPEILNAMLPYYSEIYGNSSSAYSLGRKAKAALENARTLTAGCLGAGKAEIFFTSGGTESNNWVILQTLQAAQKSGKTHFITSQIEHPSVLNAAKYWRENGGTVSFLPVSKEGIVNPADVAAAIRPATALVSVMMANNEIGTVQPIEEIGEICRSHGVLFHTDAVQAAGHLPIDLQTLPVDFLSFSAHKFHGPKGIGGLYVKTGTAFSSLFLGGEQERAKRPGTENIAGATGLAAAIELACRQMDTNQTHILRLRERLIDRVLEIPQSHLNGIREKRLPGNASFCFDGIEGESLLLMLDMRGICCSSGSACTSGAVDPSHVILALGIAPEIARSSLRISLSHLNTEEDIDAIAHALEECIARLRRLSPQMLV